MSAARVLASVFGKLSVTHADAEAPQGRLSDFDNPCETAV